MTRRSPHVIRITPIDPGRFAVEVHDRGGSTSHEVTVPTDMLDDLGLLDIDDERIVRESMRFLLEREPATSIKRKFSLVEIARYFDDYFDELQRRLKG